MSEVLFGQSYYLCFDPKLQAAMQPYPPLGTMYAASYLRQKGHDVALFDAVLAESEREWAEAVERERPRFAILYEDNFNYLSKMCLLRMREAAFTMIETARGAGCTVIVAGSDATDHAGDYLSQGAGFALIGEGEHTLGELMDRLVGRADTPFESIPGLAFPDPLHPGEVIQTPRRPDISDLDALPFPAWDLVDLPRYQSIWRRRHGYYSMNVVTSRGCPYHCNWCAKPIWGQRYHSRSPENVVAELKWLKERYDPDRIWFADDIMGLKPGWIERFAALMEAEGLQIPFKSLHRADLLLRDETIPALKRAGAKTVWIGAESGSQKVLDAMDKGVRVEAIYDAARRMHAAGIELAFFLQFGYPGETRDDIEKTMQMVRDCHPDDIGIAVSYPLPGTRFHEAIRAELGAKRNWTDSSDLAMMYRGPFTTAFYRQLHTVVHREFRARKAREALGSAIRHPVTLRPRHLRQAAALVRHVVTLPLDRLRLEWLARSPHQGLALLPGAMAAEAAAKPTAQE
jgi:anaerobic magnesium-protoporphyrin IX monomethyl ester cyclase